MRCIEICSYNDGYRRQPITLNIRSKVRKMYVLQCYAFWELGMSRRRINISTKNKSNDRPTKTTTTISQRKWTLCNDTFGKFHKNWTRAELLKWSIHCASRVSSADVSLPLSHVLSVSLSIFFVFSTISSIKMIHTNTLPDATQWLAHNAFWNAILIVSVV